MNKFLPCLLVLAILFIYFPGTTKAQITPSSNWTWLHGDNRTPLFPVHGTQYIAAPENTPGGRKAAAGWKDASGNMWLYGGTGFGFDCNFFLSDLWKYNVSTNQWTWMSGSRQENELPIFGTKGVAAATNTPGARIYPTTWTDLTGNLWLFGGFVWGTGSATHNLINDLWKYDVVTNMWTWVSGDNVPLQPGVYGVQGVPSSNNKPGFRENANAWTDAAGNFWMYGGAYLEANNGGSGGYSDLWRYNPSTNQWTWMKGDNTANQPANYGTQGVAAATNNPGARNQAMSSIDQNGNFWLFGGRTGDDNSPTYLNDLWKYDPVTNNWTWVKGSSSINMNPVYGTMGVPAPNNNPGGRTSGIFWADTSGNLLVGAGNGIGFSYGPLNDMWKYNIGTNQWAWIKGDQVSDQSAVYGSQGIPAAANNPGGRCKTPAMVDAGGNLYLVGGEYLRNVTNNDVWKYNTLTNEWVWLKGDNKRFYAPVYGTQSVSNNANSPGEKSYMAPWNDNAGNLWAFGGVGIGGNYNTVWKYNPDLNEWAWIKGNNSPNTYGIYGTKGVAAPANTPGARYGQATWTDASGNFWIFGGDDAYLSSPNIGFTNELWKYDITTNQWTWMNGSNQINVYGTYGTMGVPAAANTPGARRGSYTWVDSNGDFWLLGGWGYAGPAFPNGLGLCSDLWKYSVATNQWTWMKGANFIDAWPVYGTRGIEAATNQIGGRDAGATWTDATGNLWLFGGGGYTNSGSGALNDIWRYNITTGNWTWMKGDNLPDRPGVYGTQGVAAATNKPGGHGPGVSFKDQDGNFWFWGGSGGVNELHKGDLWKYDMATGFWTWIKGDTSHNQYGVYGTKGVTAVSNKPGTRMTTVGWYVDGNMWLYSGAGSSSDQNGPLKGNYLTLSYSYGLNDLWLLGIAPVPPDTVRLCENAGTSITSNITGTTYQWQQSTGSGYVNISDNSNFSGTTTATLQLTNIPASWNSYVYKCIVNGVQTSKKFRLFIVPVTATAAATPTSCSGLSDGKITVTPTGGVSPYTYSIDGGSFQTSNIFTALSSGNHTVVIRDVLLCTRSIIVNVPSGVFPITVPTVSITASPSNTICSGTSVTFTATATNQGVSPVYQWKVNGVNAGTNSTTFTTNTLNDNDQVSVVLTSSRPCAIPNIVTSNVITMTVNSGGLTANAGNDVSICSGGSTQLQGSGGTTYSWSPTTGLSNPNISNPVATPATTTQYILTVSNGTCSAKDTVVVTVNASAPASVSVTANQTNICSGTLVTFTATPVNGGTTPVYQWLVNGVNAGTNSNTFTSATLNNNDQVKVVLTSSLSCASPANATSNVITMSVSPAPTAHAGNDTAICAGSSVQLLGSGGTVYQWTPAVGLSNPNIANPIATPLANTAYILKVSNGGTCFAYDTILITLVPSVAPTAAITTASNSVCIGTAVAFTATSTNGGTTPAYQWQVNGVNAGTNSNTFTTSSLTNNTQVKVIVTSSLTCASPATATSNVITMTVTATPNANAGNDVNICTGGSTQLQASGGTTYSWSPVAGLSNPNIANPVASPAVTTTYTVTVSNGVNCTANDAVVVSVGPPATPVVSISTTSSTICQGSAATFTAVATNGGSNPVFQWQVNGVNAGTNNNTFISSTLNNNDQVKAILTSSSACVTSTTATSNTITMIVDQLATPLISLSNRLYTVTNPDAAAIYTWQQKINNNWVNVVPAATGTTYTATSGGEYRVKAVKGACTAFSLSQTTARNLNTFMHPFGIYLYPNPNSGILNIDSIRISQRWETLDITDVTGRLVLTFNIKNQSSVSLNISMLKPGTYFAQLKKIDGVYYTVEFVKL